MSDAELVKAFDELHIVSARRTLLPARLGIRAGASYTIDVPDRAGYKYVSMGANGERGQAVAKDAIGVDDVGWQQVWVRRENRQLVIREADHLAGGGGGGSTTLAALTDVDVTGAADGDILMYDSASENWIPFTPSGSTGDAPSPHALDSAHHSGTLADSQAPQFLKTDGTRALTGNLAVSSGITIDGIDISAHAANPAAHHNPVTVGNTGLSLSTQVLSLNLATDSGLEISSGVRVKAYHGINRDSNGIGVKLKTTSGLVVDTNGLAVGAGDGIDVLTATIAVDVTDIIDTAAGLQEDGSNNIQVKLDSSTGLQFAAGGGLELGTPATLTYNTTNSVSAATHSHAVTASADVGSTPAESLLKSTSGGGLGLASLTMRGNIAFAGADRSITGTHDISISPTVDLNLTPVGDLIMDPTGLIVLPDAQTMRSVTFNDFVAGIQGFSFFDRGGNVRQLTTGAIKADELHVRVFSADEQRVSRGAEFWAYSFGIVQETFTVPADEATVDVWFEEAPDLGSFKLFVAGDWILFRTLDADSGLVTQLIRFQVVDADGAGTNDYIARQAATTEVPSRQQWRLRRKSGGITGMEVKKGSVGVDFGKPFSVTTPSPGQGVVHLSALDFDDGPFIQIQTFDSVVSDVPQFKNRVRMGNLRNTLDYGSSIYGLAAGNDISLVPSSGNFSGFAIDEDEGLRIFGGSITMYDGSTIKLILDEEDGLNFLYDTTVDGSGVDRYANWYTSLAGTPSNAVGKIGINHVAGSSTTMHIQNRRVDAVSGETAEPIILIAARDDVTASPTNGVGSIEIKTSRIELLAAGTSTRIIDRGLGFNASFPGDNLVGTYDYPSTYRFLQADGASARLLARGSTDAALDLIDSGAGADVKWMQLHTESGTFQIRRVLDTGVPGSALLSIAHSGGLVTVGNAFSVGGAATLSSTLDVTGIATIGDGINPTGLRLNAAALGIFQQSYRVAAVNRWIWTMDASTEAGSNSGSNLALWSRDDAGASISSNVLYLQRDTGNVGLSVAPTSRLHVYNNDALTDNTVGHTIEQDGTGDASLRWVLTGLRTFTAGIDNSDGDNWKLSVGTALGTNDFIIVNPTTGEVTINGLTGGSAASGLIAGDGIDLIGSTIAVDTTVVRTTRTITSGNGLTGGGDLSTNRTFDVVALSTGGLQVNANDIQIKLPANSGLTTDATGLYLSSSLAGDGLALASGVLSVNVGTGIAISADTVILASSVAGAGLAYASGVLSVNASTGLATSGDDVILASSAAGAGLAYAAGVLAVNAATGLAISGDNVILASSAAGAGLAYASGVLSVNASGGLALSGDDVVVDASLAGAGMTFTSPALNIIALSTGGLQVNADSIQIKLPATSGLHLDSTGLWFHRRGDTGDTSGLSMTAADGVWLDDDLAGSGLVWTDAATRFLNVGAGNGITVSTDAVAVNQGFAFSWSALHTFGAGATFNLGTFTFNTAPQVNANLNFAGTARTITSAANLTLNPTGDLILDPTGLILLPNAQEMRSSVYDDAVTGIQGYRLWNVSGNVNQLTIGAIKADELHVRVFSADEVRISRGEQFWSYSFGIVETTFVTPVDEETVNVWFENAPALAEANLFVVNDWLLVATIDWDTGLDISRTWFQVVALVTAGSVDGYRQQWTIRRKSGGTTSNPIPKGAIAIDVGQIGQGQIHLSALSASGGPFIQFGTFTSVSSDTPQFTQRVRIGHLSGAAGMGSGTWGFATGNSLALTPTSGFSGLISDSVDGLRLYNTDINLYDSTNLIIALTQDEGLAIEKDDDDLTPDYRRWIVWYNDLADTVAPPLGGMGLARASGSGTNILDLFAGPGDEAADSGQVHLVASTNSASFHVRLDSQYLYAFDTGASTYALYLTDDGNLGVNIPISTTPVSIAHFYENTSSVGATAGVTIEQDGAGDAVLQWLLTGGQRWAIGIDNSATGDPLKIAASADVGTSTLLTLTNTGALTIASTGNFGGVLSAPTLAIAGAATFGGALSGITSLTMAGALSGVTNLSMSGNLSGAVDVGLSGQLHIGNTPVTTHIMSMSKDGGNAQFSVNTYGTSFSSFLQLFSARGTGAAPANNVAGDILGQIYFQGWDGNRSNSALIYTVAASGWGGSSADSPGDLIFATVPDGSGVLSDRMIIASDGNVGIGTMTPGVDVVGTHDYTSTVRLLQVDGTAARILIRGSANAGLDMIDTSASANLRWIQFFDDAGVAKFRSLDDAGGVLTDNILTIQHDSARVGIGTATPQANESASRLTIAASDSQPHYISVENFGTGQAGIVLRRTGGTTSRWIHYIPSGSDSLRIYSGTLVDDVMTFAADGNVGIGTTTPGENIVGTYDYSNTRLLQVNGSASARVVVRGSAEAALDLIDTASATNQKWMQLRNSAGTTSFVTRDDTGDPIRQNILLMDHDTGYIGVNDGSPTAWLELAGEGGSVSNVRSTVYSDGSGFQFVGRRSKGTKASPTAVGAGSTLMVLVGVGYTNGGWSTNQSAEISMRATEGYINGASGGGGGEILFYTRANGSGGLPTHAMTIQQDGALVVPYIWSNAVNGTAVQINSNGILTKAVSSIRYKTNIRELPDTFGDDFIMRLKPILYNNKAGDDASDYVGFVAEDVFGIGGAPFVSHNDAGQVESLHYDKLTVPLVGATQRLINDRNEDRKRIAWLERQVAELERRLAA